MYSVTLCPTFHQSSLLSHWFLGILLSSDDSELWLSFSHIVALFCCCCCCWCFFLSFFLSSSSFSSSSSWGLPSAALGRLISRHRFHLDTRSPRTESLESLSTFGVLHQWPEVTEIVFGTFWLRHSATRLLSAFGSCCNFYIPGINRKIAMPLLSEIPSSHFKHVARNLLKYLALFDLYPVRWPIGNNLLVAPLP